MSEIKAVDVAETLLRRSDWNTGKEKILADAVIEADKKFSLILSYDETPMEVRHQAADWLSKHSSKT